jgi:methionine-S-sulfoxide reductase
MDQQAHNSIILAGGCFWGVQELLRTFPGVLRTEVGYCGGTTPNPVYEDVKTGSTGHAEAVFVEYDPSRVSLEKILHFFFRMHNPTTVNQQGNDKGSQYRSTIFVSDDQEKSIAQRVIDEVNQSGRWKSPVVTTLEPRSKFYSAEDYHQDYLQKNPQGYNCHYIRN